MLGNKKPGTGSGGGGTTLISKDTRIIGDVHFTGCLDIEGVVQGNVVAEDGKDALVRVIDSGRVEGDLRAPAIVINGMVQGNVHAEQHLELAPKARVEGDVFYALVEMAAGAEVNGGMKHVAAGGARKGAAKVLDMAVASGEHDSDVSGAKS